MEDAYIYDAVRSPRGKGRKDGIAARGHGRAAVGTDPRTAVKDRVTISKATRSRT